MTVLLVLGMLFALLSADFLVQRLRLRKAASRVASHATSMSIEPCPIPDDVELARNHLWVCHGADGVAVVGCDEFVVRFFGGTQGITLPAVHQRAESLELYDGGRSVWLTLPVTGTVVSVNNAASRNQALAAGDPYGAGWLLTIKADHRSSMPVIAAAHVREWLASQAAEACAFLHDHAVVGEFALMHDGGVPVQGVMHAYDGDVWEEFERRFFVTEAPELHAAGGMK